MGCAVRGVLRGRTQAQQKPIATRKRPLNSDSRIWWRTARAQHVCRASLHHAESHFSSQYAGLFSKPSSSSPNGSGWVATDHPQCQMRPLNCDATPDARGELSKAARVQSQLNGVKHLCTARKATRCVLFRLWLFTALTSRTQLSSPLAHMISSDDATVRTRQL